MERASNVQRGIFGDLFLKSNRAQTSDAIKFLYSHYTVLILTDKNSFNSICTNS